jgi:hypothetical protein
MLDHVESSRVGLSGASKVSDRSPRELVLKVIEQNPGIEKKQAFELFLVAVGTDRGYWRAMAFYFFVHMWEYAFGPATRTKPDPIQRLEDRQRETDMVERAKAQIMLLDLKMPNDKPMRDCTGAEMAKFGNRYQRIAEKVGKAKLVGAVLSEDQVRGIMK